MHPYYYHVRLFPGNYIVQKKTFMEKYLPQLHRLKTRNDAAATAAAAFGTSKKAKPPPKKVVVFDLDETIGSFSPIFDIWQLIVATQPSPHRRDQLEPLFHQLMYLFPELFRPGIFTLLRFVFDKCQQGDCFPIHVYTNNQCSLPFWVDMILSFITKKIHQKSTTHTSLSSPLPAGEWQSVTRAASPLRSEDLSVFARPICAYTICGKRHERWRTSHDKGVPDLLRCSSSPLPRHVEICFVDDQMHQQMRDDPRVFYIQPFPFYAPLTEKDIYSRFRHSELHHAVFVPKNVGTSSSSMMDKGDQLLFDLLEKDKHKHKEKDKSNENENVDLYEQISDQMMEYMVQFFQSTNHIPTNPKKNMKKTMKVAAKKHHHQNKKKTMVQR